MIVPENSTAWGKVDARSELCAGSKCKQYERCFITLMHQRAADADIIINDKEISRWHCAIEIKDDVIRLRDLESTT